MHTEVRAFVQRVLDNVEMPRKKVLEIGSRDLNGGLRDLFRYSFYVGIDRYPGPGVDVVGDARFYETSTRFDTIVSTSVFEHEQYWGDIIIAAERLLCHGGIFICTTVADPYPVHSGIEPVGYLIDDEYYGNVDPAALARVIEDMFARYTIERYPGGDLFAVAWKGV